VRVIFRDQRAEVEDIVVSLDQIPLPGEAVTFSTGKPQIDGRVRHRHWFFNPQGVDKVVVTWEW
jgi:hypothetical protein